MVVEILPLESFFSSVYQTKMKYRDEVWSDLNNLLAHLRSFNTIKLIEDYYKSYDNSAPSQLVREDMDRLQKHLDNAGRNTNTNILPRRRTSRR